MSKPTTATPLPANKDGSYDLSKLQTLSQTDKISDTMGDQERCSCNSTVAAPTTTSEAPP